MERMRYAVIGVGSMGKNHARAVHELKEVELVAVVDVNIIVAEAIGHLYNCKAFGSVVEMLEDTKPEAVSICVPTTLHVKIAEECIKRGIHILVEKPIAANIEDAKHMLQLAAHNDVRFMVGHIERFNPAVLKVKELLDKNEIGNIVSVMARRVGVFPPQIKDANIAVDLAIHDIDIINFLLGENPTKVVAEKRRSHIEHREDSVEIFLSYPSASAYIQANWITPVKIRKLNITGTEGYLEMDYINQKIIFYKSNYEKYREEAGEVGGHADFVLKYMEPDTVEISVAKREPLKEEIRYFLRAITDNIQIDATHAIKALEIALQC